MALCITVSRCWSSWVDEVHTLLVVDTQCSFFASASFPQPLEGGLRVARVGTSSVRYEIAVFTDAQNAVAQGHFVHVYVHPSTRRPLSIPEAMRAGLATLQV